MIKKRARTSWIWDHVPHERNIITYRTTGDCKSIWCCKHCLKEYTENGGTKAPQDHLFKAHSISSPVSATEAQQALSITKAIGRGIRLSGSSNHRKVYTTFNVPTFQQLYVRWITCCSIPLRMSERPEFRDLLAFLNEDIESVLPKNHETI